MPFDNRAPVGVEGGKLFVTAVWDGMSHAIVERHNEGGGANWVCNFASWEYECKNQIQQTRFDRPEEILLGRAIYPRSFSPAQTPALLGANSLPPSMNHSSLGLSPMFNNQSQWPDGMDTDHVK
jgi:hypothetical protein